MSAPDERPLIRLRGVRVHNLKGIDLDLPANRLIVVTGVSGAGKTSLAFDTLFAEGQRRYVESFAVHSRRRLDALERPDADLVEGVPAAIAVRRHRGTSLGRGTVSTASEVDEHLRLLFARCGELVCPDCDRPVRASTSAEMARGVAELPPGTKVQLGFSLEVGLASPSPPPRTSASLTDLQVGGEGRGEESTSKTRRTRAARTKPSTSPVDTLAASLALLREAGFQRVLTEGRTVDLRDVSPEFVARLASAETSVRVVVDRVTAGTTPLERLNDSFELAASRGNGRAWCLVEQGGTKGREIEIDGRSWRLREFSTRRECTGCGRAFPEPDAPLLSFLGPQGACASCGGTGLATGRPRDRDAEAASDQTSIRCTECHGRRWNSDALAYRWRGLTLAEFSAGTVAQRRDELQRLLDQSGGPAIKDGAFDEATVDGARCLDTRVSPTADERIVLPQLLSRLVVLAELGLAHLGLDRSPATLSAGEWRRVRLANALGCELVEALYVLDEPTAGLHPSDTGRLIALLERLRDAGNTVVVVEHDDEVVSRADWVVDLGPGAGIDGGRVLYSGPPDGLVAETGSITAKWRARPPASGGDRRVPADWIQVRNARGRNLQHLDVRFPLGVLCVVTGVGGAGKSSLVGEVLYRAWRDRLAGRFTPAPPDLSAGACGCDAVEGGEFVRWVRRVDATPPAKSRRANVSTYLGVHDEVRKLLAATPTAKSRQFTAGTFSFHSPSGGRCPVCEGEGFQRVDLQFLPDVAVPCSACGGARFKPEVLEATFRGLNVAQMLDLSVGDAFAFFRGSVRVQKRLKHVKDVGLDHLPLGRSLATLSGGEAQRLKLARELDDSGGERGALFLEEPTTGLHAADVERLLGCLNQLVDTGHSLFIIEHHPRVIAVADWVIDLGPGSGPDGGRIVRAGPPLDHANVG
jgi:excinuclease ABC subunit A